MENLNDKANNNNQLTDLKERVLRSSPWRALQGESSFEVVMQLAQQDDLPEKTRFMTLDRAGELATNLEEKVQAIVSRLDILLDGENKKQAKDLQKQVQALLDEVESTDPALLRYRARHQLMQNSLTSACEDYAAAFEACQKLGNNDLTKIVALECIAAEAIRAGLMSANQKACFEKLLELDALPENVSTREEMVGYGEDYFWFKLYRPYHGIQKIEAPKENNKAALDKFFELMRNGQWDEMKTWLDASASKTRKPAFENAQQETLLVRLLITMDEYRELFSSNPALATLEQNPLEPLLEDMRRGIGLVLKAWPEQAKSSDIKGQTPLMLAAAAGEVTLAELLAPVSEISAQDYLGKAVQEMVGELGNKNARKDIEKIIGVSEK